MLSPDRLEYQREWKAKNPEKVRAYNKLWRSRHRDEILAKGALKRQEPTEKQRRAAVAKAYKANIPDFVRKNDAVRSAKSRATQRGIEFRITTADLVWPTHCPVLGIKLNYGKASNGRGSDDSPSLDRHIPSLGYVPGNVFVMSWRANRLKCDGTVEEFYALIEYLRKTRSN